MNIVLILFLLKGFLKTLNDLETELLDSDVSNVGGAVTTSHSFYVKEAGCDQ